MLIHEFTENGWIAVGTGRSKQPNDFPAGATYKQFDASDANACVSFWKQLHSEHPDAEVCLVNNAGGYVSGSLNYMKPEDYEQQVRSAYFSAVYMTHGLAATIPAARIINIISSSALTAYKNESAYGAAKAAEMHFFQSLQQEFKPEQYRITSLYLSDIATHGANPDAISAEDLATFVREQATNQTSYYLQDVTIYPVNRQ